MFADVYGEACPRFLGRIQADLQEVENMSSYGT